MIFFLFSTGLQSQNIANVMHFGDQLYENKSYKSALNEYQRAFYFATDNQKHSIAHKIADCYIALYKTSDAKNFCDSAYTYADNDSTRAESFLKKTSCLLIDEQYGDALTLLKKSDFSFNPKLQIKKQILSGIACLGINDFHTADFYFTGAVEDSEKYEKIKHLLSDNKKISQPYPLLAGGMSAVLPGSGQIYAGKYIEGLNSIALLSGLTYLGLNIPVLNILFSTMFVRYYMGGFTRAYRYAEEKRDLKRTAVKNEVMKIFPDYNLFLKNVNNENEFESFRKLAFESDGEIPILISTAFLLYKKILSAQDVDACVFTPTCSVYMMETIRKNGIVKGFLDGTDRLLRCHGFADHNHYQVNINTGKLYDVP